MGEWPVPPRGKAEEGEGRGDPSVEAHWAAASDFQLLVPCDLCCPLDIIKNFLVERNIPAGDPKQPQKGKTTSRPRKPEASFRMESGALSSLLPKTPGTGM